MHSLIESPKVAYLSMEIGIESDTPIYSGGLGVLAGDVIARYPNQHGAPCPNVALCTPKLSRRRSNLPKALRFTTNQ
jgi:hypothetical protein